MLVWALESGKITAEVQEDGMDAERRRMDEKTGGRL